MPGISAGEAERLKRDKRIRRLTATIELATERTGSAVGGVPVLAVWVDDDQLERLELDRPSALCVIPWLPANISRWRDAYGPTNMRSGEPATAKQLASPVVERALESLTMRVNLSTGLGHPSDKAAAVGVFRILKSGGERYDVDEVAAWAATNGWGLGGARELSEIAQGVLEGRRYQVERHGWREDILEQWRDGA